MAHTTDKINPEYGSSSNGPFRTRMANNRNYIGFNLSCSKKECTGYKEPLVYTLGQNDMIMFASWGIFGLEFL